MLLPLAFGDLTGHLCLTSRRRPWPYQLACQQPLAKDRPLVVLDNATDAQVRGFGVQTPSLCDWDDDSTLIVVAHRWIKQFIHRTMMMSNEIKSNDEIP